MPESNRAALMGAARCVSTLDRQLLRGEAADFDCGAEPVAAGFTEPAVADAAFIDESGALRHKLLVIALRAERAGKITGKRENCGRSIQVRHARPPCSQDRELESRFSLVNKTVKAVCGDNASAS
jgi:hypothetical protein